MATQLYRISDMWGITSVAVTALYTHMRMGCHEGNTGWCVLYCAVLCGSVCGGRAEGSVGGRYSSGGGGEEVRYIELAKFGATYPRKFAKEQSTLLWLVWPSLLFFFSIIFIRICRYG